MRKGTNMPQDVFEEYADDYDRWFDEHQDEYRTELSRIRRVLPASDSRAIEVGVGSGRFAAPVGIGIGIEPSRRLCRMARQRGIDVIRGVAEALPIRNESCSSVLLVTVICYLDDPETALGEVARVLIPGGVLTLAFIEREGAIHKKYLRKGGKGRFLSRARFYSRDEAGRFLRNAGFTVHTIDASMGFCVMVSRKG